MRCYRFFVVLLVFGCLAPLIATADESRELVESIDMSSLGLLSKQTGLPIILVYMAKSCEYCDRLEQDLLKPMLQQQEFAERGLLRKLRVDGYESVVDFKGRSRSAKSFSALRDVDVTPTIQFVDGDGNEIVPPIVGYQSPDFFPAYFRQAMEVSLQLLRQR